MGALFRPPRAEAAQQRPGARGGWQGWAEHGLRWSKAILTPLWVSQTQQNISFCLNLSKTKHSSSLNPEAKRCTNALNFKDHRSCSRLSTPCDPHGPYLRTTAEPSELQALPHSPGTSPHPRERWAHRHPTPSSSTRLASSHPRSAITAQLPGNSLTSAHSSRLAQTLLWPLSSPPPRCFHVIRETPVIGFPHPLIGSISPQHPCLAPLPTVWSSDRSVHPPHSLPWGQAVSPRPQWGGWGETVSFGVKNLKI